MNMQSQEILYKHILIKNIPTNLDLTKEKNMQTMEFINNCYEENKEKISEFFSIDKNGNLIIPSWGKGYFTKTLLKSRDLLRGNILFTNVIYVLNHYKLEISDKSRERIAKIEQVYKENREEFENHFPKKKIDDKEINVVPCTDLNKLNIKFEKKETYVQINGHLYFSISGNKGWKKRRIAIQQYLRKFTLEELEQRFIKENNDAVLEIITFRGRRYLNIPSNIDVNYFVSNNNDIHHKQNKEVEIKTIEISKEIEKNIIKTPGPLRVDSTREPLGSMRPRRVVEIDYKVKNAKSKLVKNGNLTPFRNIREVNVFVRDQTIVNQLKTLYGHVCQICNEKVEVGTNQYATEVHHIQPLGVHHGPDIKENMIVLCPNHHVMFDRGAITINLINNIVQHINPSNPLNQKSFIIKHKINKDYINYHYNNIFSSKVKLN